MTTESQPRLKITYATLRADNEQLHREYEAGLAEAKRSRATAASSAAGRDGDGTFEVRSPIDTDILSGRSRRARKDVQDAIAPRAAQPAG
jgi:hypothetical protein